MSIGFAGKIPDDIMDLYRLFDGKGFELSIVGGWVRDYFLDVESHDMDLTTNARPEQIKEIVAEWADDMWSLGEAFGTIALRKNDINIEITTYREDAYNDSSRKPTVVFGDSLEANLARRDFTINAMAVKLPNIFVDPFFGKRDLRNKILETPRSSRDSISDDPLRIYRAARFISKYNMVPKFSLSTAIILEKCGLSKVSAERISAELEKIIMTDNPVLGLDYLLDTGVLNDEEISTQELQWLMVMKSPVSLTLRFAALFSNLTPDEVVVKMRSLRFPNKLIRSVANIVMMVPIALDVKTHNQARRFIMKAGNSLVDIISLAQVVSPVNFYDSVIKDIAFEENLSDTLDGKEIMCLLDITDGPVIGEAIKEMRDYIAENGPMNKLVMGSHLLTWYTIRKSDV